MSSKTKPKILVIRFSSIGDIVLTTPILRCLSQQLQAELHFLTKAVYSPLLKLNPHISKIHTIDKSLDVIIPVLKACSFDYVIDLHKNIRSKKIVASLRVKTFTLYKRSVDRWLLVHMKIDRLKGNHIVDRYFSAVHSLNVRNDGKGLDFFLPTTQEQSFDLPNEYVVLVIGSKHKTKDLPVHLMNSVLKEMDSPVVLIGGKEHASTANKIVSPNSLYNLVGKTSLLDSAAIINNAKLVISPDTGMLHIAAALTKPLIAIYGSTSSSLGFIPYMPGKEHLYKIVEDSSLACRPCTKMGRDSCPKTHYNCMNNLNYHTIVEKAQALID